MARTALTVQELGRNGEASTITWTSADATNDHEFQNTGREILMCRNENAATRDVTVVSVSDRFGRSGDVTKTVPAAAAGAAGFAAWGPLLPENFNSSGNLAYVDLTVDTDLEFAVIRIHNPVR